MIVTLVDAGTVITQLSSLSYDYSAMFIQLHLPSYNPSVTITQLTITQLWPLSYDCPVKSPSYDLPAMTNHPAAIVQLQPPSCNCPAMITQLWSPSYNHPTAIVQLQSPSCNCPASITQLWLSSYDHPATNTQLQSLSHPAATTQLWFWYQTLHSRVSSQTMSQPPPD